MSDISVKGIDKTRSKENYNSTQSQITVQLQSAPDADWIGAFNSGWKKTELNKVAAEVILNKDALVVRYRKGTDVTAVYDGVLKAVEATNESQSTFYSQIDSINLQPVRDLMKNLGGN
jgi:hypothetical protein